MIDQGFTDHGKDCLEAAEKLRALRIFDKSCESSLRYKDLRIEELESQLSDHDDLQLCDCCEGLFELVHDANGHMQCDQCTRIAELKAKNAELADLCMNGVHAALAAEDPRIEKLEAIAAEAARYISLWHNVENTSLAPLAELVEAMKDE
jgi:hypothetical protein